MSILKEVVADARTAVDPSEVNHGEMVAIIETAMDAIITVDEGQRIVIFNAAAEGMFCCPGAQAIGSIVDAIYPAPISQGAAIRCRVMVVLLVYLVQLRLLCTRKTPGR